MGRGTEASGGKFVVSAIFCAILGASSSEASSATGPIPQESATSVACAAPEENGHHRAGHPERRACYAQPSNECNYSKGYVGGGTQFHGDGRFAPEGTWGRDYCGWIVSHRPWLNWSHGRRYQGGRGAYKTDGPKLLGH